MEDLALPLALEDYEIGTGALDVVEQGAGDRVGASDQDVVVDGGRDVGLFGGQRRAGDRGGGPRRAKRGLGLGRLEMEPLRQRVDHLGTREIVGVVDVGGGAELEEVEQARLAERGHRCGVDDEVVGRPFHQSVDQAVRKQGKQPRR